VFFHEGINLAAISFEKIMFTVPLAGVHLQPFRFRSAADKPAKPERNQTE